MTDTHALARLARQMGIGESYWDIFGGFHETAPATQKALLDAMGCDVSSDAAIRREAELAETAEWRRGLAPVSVPRGGEAATGALLSLPKAALARRLRWRLELEDGGEITGEAVPAELPPEESVEIDGADYVRVRLALPPDTAEGYHRLRVEDGKTERSSRLVVAPPHAYRPAWMERDRRHWGWACHLYGLRSERNWGIGDFSDLAALADGAHGAAVLGINPLHSLFTPRPEEASPYSPSSRTYLNPLYIDVTAAPEFAWSAAARRMVEAPGFAADMRAARDAPLVDYGRVSAMKLSVLEALYDDFAAGHAPDARRAAFVRFVDAGGEPLRRYSLFEALQAHFGGEHWTRWPEPFRRPDSAESSAFARDHARAVAFFAYVQFLADEQLGAAAVRCADAGMAVGLYRDLAVGASPFGADVWADQEVYAMGARVGAPPDAFNAQGQDWGLPPLHPTRLREAAYEPFIRMVRANMRHAGALRIDHAMAIQRLFWLTPGRNDAPGAYVSYPMEDLLGILALESKRNRCIVIGEDLGTVPEGFRERMDAEAVLSYRVLFFERYPDGLYRRPETYPDRSVAIALTHDMPTIAGYWQGKDLAQRRDVGLIDGDAAMAAAVAERDRDRALLLAALRDRGLLPDGNGAEDPPPERLVEAVERFLARAQSRLMLANIDDAMLEPDQLNMPGTVFEYPNWRRKLSEPLERFAENPFAAALARAMAEDRERTIPKFA